jgi:hypothetical protein
MVSFALMIIAVIQEKPVKAARMLPLLPIEMCPILTLQIQVIAVWILFIAIRETIVFQLSAAI